MEKRKIRNSLLGLMIVGLLAVMAQDALAQRPIARPERGSDVNRPERTKVKKDKIVKQSRHKARKARTLKPGRTEARYAKKENRRKQYRDSNRGRKSYKRATDRAYKQRYRKNHFPVKKHWQRGPYRRATWLHYYRPGYRYPRIGRHVSVLPYGYISLVIGNFRFYAYKGVFYRYDPALRVYVVVNKPRLEARYASETWDRIVLMDGSTIEGVYHYSDNDIAYFEVGDAMLEIPMSEIKVLYLSEN